MSRKDYVEFAAMFQNSRTTFEMIYGAAKIFAADNPNFKPYTFFKAAGVDEVTSNKWADTL